MAHGNEDLQYIRCEMTPTSVGGEQQISISGGSQSPIGYSLRQDCRDAQKKYVMHCMTRISQQECRGILEREEGCPPGMNPERTAFFMFG